MPKFVMFKHMGTLLCSLFGAAPGPSTGMLQLLIILCLATTLSFYCCQMAHAHKLLVYIYSLLFPGPFPGGVYSNLAIPL